ncbi:MAG: HAMP domain-containing protein, partial [Bacteroidales bacterium]|nr:HAMP domain-containing protein [Bacteroidales bacterium]
MIVIMLFLMMAAMLFIGLYLWVSLETFYNETHTRTMEQATFPLQFSAREFLLRDQTLKEFDQQILELQQQADEDETTLLNLQKQRDDLAVAMIDLQENLSILVRASAPLERDNQGDSFQLAVLDSALKPVAKTVGINVLEFVDYSLLNQTLLFGQSKETRMQYVKPDGTTQDMKVLTFPVKEGDRVLGMIYVESGISSIATNLGHVRSLVVAATFGSMLIIALVASGLAGTITGPVRVLNARAKEMAAGDFNSQINIQSEDEVGELGKTFNSLTLRLRDTLEEIADEKSKMEAMLNFMTEGVIAIDSAGQIIHMNPAAGNMFHIRVQTAEQL